MWIWIALENLHHEKSRVAHMDTEKAIEVFNDYESKPSCKRVRVKKDALPIQHGVVSLVPGTANMVAILST